MALFQAFDREGELLKRYFEKEGYSKEALDAAVCSAKKEIENGKPLAYVIKEEAFYDLVFYVDERVLIPRPDTERLVEAVIASLARGGRFLELGTGSGCIPITILKHRPDLLGVSMDLSADALAVAEKNAAMICVSDRLVLRQGDMKQNPFEDELFDAVISNPPYIPRADIAKYPSLSYEPMMALDGGEDGMDFYRAIMTQYRKNLKAGGGFFFEIGFDQGDLIRSLGEEFGYTCKIIKDYGQRPCGDSLSQVFV